jgi:hypothetical protein
MGAVPFQDAKCALLGKRVMLSRVRISGRAVVSVLKENPRHGKTTVDPG